MTFSFRRLPFFQIFSDYSTEIFALLACQLEGIILKAIFLLMPCDSMRQKLFLCDFLRFVDISFHFVYISHCVTHSLQRAPVNISFHTSILICRAETSVLVKKSNRNCSFMQYNWFFYLKHTKIDFGRLKLGVIFKFKTPCTEWVGKEGQEIFTKLFCLKFVHSLKVVL